MFLFIIFIVLNILSLGYTYLVRFLASWFKNRPNSLVLAVISFRVYHLRVTCIVIVHWLGRGCFDPSRLPGSSTLPACLQPLWGVIGGEVRRPTGYCAVVTLCGGSDACLTLLSSLSLELCRVQDDVVGALGSVDVSGLVGLGVSCGCSQTFVGRWAYRCLLQPCLGLEA